MKKNLSILVLLALCILCQGKTINKTIVEDGGLGPYKAVIVEDDALPGYSIFRPEDLANASAVEGKLPVVLFGNGGCSKDSWGFVNFLTHLSSHGYVIISNGKWSAEPPRREPVAAPQGGQAPPIDMEAMMAEFKRAEKGNADDARDYLRALDWLQKESSTPGSEYFGMVDTFNTAAMGQSCGGLQALILGTSQDPRIKTTVPLNSGVTSPGDGLSGMISKDDLAKLSRPICYLIGGESDIAFRNATDDFTKIDNVPVAIANLPVGHGGTYRDEHGGEFGEMALLWLDYQLKGKTENEVIFKYGQPPVNLSSWSMTSKNFSQMETIRLYDEKPSENTEEIRYNVFGEVDHITKVNDPSITVSLPDPDKADGSAILIYPGGALVALSWDSEFKKIADFLNARGIAAIGVKYRLRTSFGRMAPPSDTDNKFLRMQGKIYDFTELEKANTNPSVPDPSDRSTDNAADDALRATQIVRENAAKWNIDPDRIGWMGFSAGGGVELAALMKARKEEMPAFICSVYGPSLVDITVPEGAPKLFVAVHADHPNVAAGCMALFMEWKKAGVDSEIHVYGEKSGGFFGGAGSSGAQKTTPQGRWIETFYSWLVANEFVK